MTIKSSIRDLKEINNLEIEVAKLKLEVASHRKTFEGMAQEMHECKEDHSYKSFRIIEREQ